jgi:histidinol-phosphatase (PHP family)
MSLSNFHAHTTYCDGTESPEAMVKAAIGKGLEAFGLSGHAYMGFDTDWCMTRAGTAGFIAEMDRLKNRYGDKIALFTGVEQDYYSTEPVAGFDYVIGSVHYIRKDGEYLLVDDAEDVTVSDVKRCYGGDYYAYTRDYFRTLADIVPKTRPDFIGHFDLVTKFNEGGKLFDEADPRYLSPALEALAAITETLGLFEINTGAMYRVGRTAPYPSRALLKALKERGGEIILSSDSHDGESIGYKFGEARELAKACGFEYAKTLTADGFVDYKL